MSGTLPNQVGFERTSTLFGGIGFRSRHARAISALAEAHPAKQPNAADSPSGRARALFLMFFLLFLPENGGEP